MPNIECLRGKSLSNDELVRSFQTKRYIKLVSENLIMMERYPAKYEENRNERKSGSQEVIVLVEGLPVKYWVGHT